MLARLGSKWGMLYHFPQDCRWESNTFLERIARLYIGRWLLQTECRLTFMHWFSAWSAFEELSSLILSAHTPFRCSTLAKLVGKIKDTVAVEAAHRWSQHAAWWMLSPAQPWGFCAPVVIRAADNPVLIMLPRYAGEHDSTPQLSTSPYAHNRNTLYGWSISISDVSLSQDISMRLFTPTKGAEPDPELWGVHSFYESHKNFMSSCMRRPLGKCWVTLRRLGWNYAV